MKLRRSGRNPILKPRGDDWEALAVFNCAAIERGSRIYLLYRAVGEYREYVSRLGYAVLDRELNLVERSSEPVFGPDVRLWELSIEDPRLVEVEEEGEVYMTYVTTPTPAPPAAVRLRLGLPKPQQAHPRAAVARLRGFWEFERLGVITPYDAEERDVVLFPKKFDGRFAVLHRPANWVGSGYPVSAPSIWFAWLDGIPGVMHGHRVVMEPEEEWEASKIGAGPPPIETEEGWLLIYHGVDENNVYRAGAALLDPREPWKVIARTREPILEPEEEYEREGDVPNVVFPEGAVVLDGELLVFYGAADKVCCVASATLNEILDALMSSA